MVAAADPTGPVTAPERCGLAAAPLPDLESAVLASWDAFLEAASAPSTDLRRPSRLPGWTGRDVCVHLGSWDDAQVVEGVLASAEAGGVGEPPDPDAGNAALLAAHRDASVDEVLAAVAAGRDRVARFFSSGEAETFGRALSRSSVGPLPVTSLIHAGCYELALHALDLAPCGAPPPDPTLADRGLAALIDVTGALCRRHGIAIELTAQAPTGGWRFCSDADGWTTEPTAPGRFEGTGVRGTTVDLLDTSAGRASLPQLLVTRRLVVQQMTSFMQLAPLLDAVPGLPGGSTLKSAVAGMSGLGRGLSRLPRLPGLRR